MSRRSVFLLSVLGCLFVAIGCWRAYAPRNTPNTPARIQMQAGMVVNDLGTFACGDSPLQLNIASMPDGTTSIHVVKDWGGPAEQKIFTTGAGTNEARPSLAPLPRKIRTADC